MYQYSEQCPLPSKQHTRYITLLPAQKSNDRLRCVLESTTLTDCPPFEAVSYVWGSDKMVSNIYCHDQAIPITANLDDAICINQVDPVEQGQQVAMMGQIYTTGYRTIVNLGPDSCKHAEAVASLLEEITRTDKRWNSYRNMVGHDWFSRTWTVQEAALGAEPYILWGSVEIPWLQFTCINQWLLSKARHVWYHLKPWLNDVHGRGFWEAEFPMPNFIETLARAKTLHCKNEIDRIYAFLGSPKAVIGKNKEVVLVPDYETDYRKIYHDLAVSWLTKTQDLMLLSAIEHHEESLRSPLPSWVPRWDVTLSTNYYGLFSSGFDASAGFPITAPDLTTENELKVTGVVFDHIIWRSAMLPKGDDWQVPVAGNTKELAAAWKHLAHFEAPRIRLPRVLAFVRTLCRQEYGNDSIDFHPDEAAFALALCCQSSCFGDVDEPQLKKAASGGDADAFVTYAGIWAGQRSVVLTEAGRYALAPALTREGDECCIFTGMVVPVVVRPVDQLKLFQFIGETFVLDVMHGELYDEQSASGAKVQDMILI
ncbi:heterokaryon incompatibility protein [Ampelomyces quisqualis]|uniref:Heterokaryon incompatibility protein n=1 Tax=Ampelomyces quisqualis TaxID=50730 RepID=A0A6A5QPG6_AMPQU|nr:heterokaryon incompatibility protein [Ampelomyces quisqualis]